MIVCSVAPLQSTTPVSRHNLTLAIEIYAFPAVAGFIEHVPTRTTIVQRGRRKGASCMYILLGSDLEHEFRPSEQLN